MNKTGRYLVLLLALLIAVIPASAQEGIYGLSAEDTAILLAGNENSFSQEQFSFTYTVGMSATVEGQTIDVALDGAGALDVPNEAGFLSIDGTAMGSTISGEMRVVGGQIYGRASDPASGADFGWFAVDIADLQGADLDTQGLQDSFNAEVFEANDIDPFALLAVGTAFLEIDPESYISATRTDDGNVATFTVNLSLSDLLRADGATDVTVALGEAFASPLSAGEAAGVNGLGAELLGDTIISLDQRVNTSSNLIEGASVLISTQIDPAAIGETGDPINVVFTFDVTVSDYGVPATIEAPADFTPVPASVIEAGIAGATGAPAPSDDGNMGDSSGGDISTGTDLGRLDCSSAAQGFRGTNASYTGICPASCDGSVWGTDVYTDDSSICTAAIHAGAIPPATGGAVTFTVVPGQASYEGTDRNGVFTLSYGEWGGGFTFDGANTAMGDMGAMAGGDTGGITIDIPLPNSYSFPTGVSFSYPGDYVVQTDSEIVTVVQLPNTPSFVQVYDLTSLFGDMDMGLDFYQTTYGGTAATTWDFAFDAKDFQEITVNSVTMSVLDFVGTQNDQTTTGSVVIVTLPNGSTTYVQSYAVGSEPPNFRDITLAVAASIAAG